MSPTVKVIIPADLKRALDGNLKRVVRNAAFAVAQELKTEVSEYPPLSEANLEGGAGSRWYQRGYGPRWKRRDGTVNGYPSSEMLNRSWAIQRTSTGAMVGSRASYSPAVHGWKEQAKFHKRRGWRTDKAAVAAIRKRGLIDRAVKLALMAEMGK